MNTTTTSASTVPVSWLVLRPLLLAPARAGMLMTVLQTDFTPLLFGILGSLIASVIAVKVLKL